MSCTYLEKLWRNVIKTTGLVVCSDFSLLDHLSTLCLGGVYSGQWPHQLTCCLQCLDLSDQRYIYEVFFKNVSYFYRVGDFSNRVIVWLLDLILFVIKGLTCFWECLSCLNCYIDIPARFMDFETKLRGCHGSPKLALAEPVLADRVLDSYDIQWIFGSISLLVTNFKANK